jgi:hypothetical protein
MHRRLLDYFNELVRYSHSVSLGLSLRQSREKSPHWFLSRGDKLRQFRGHKPETAPFSSHSGSLALTHSVNQNHSSWRGTMTTLRKTIPATAIAALLAGTMTTTPASAWYYRNNNGAAIAGAVIGGMALGAAVGTLVSQPNYNYGYGGGYGTGYGYGPGYANGYGYGYVPYRTAPSYNYGGGYGYGNGYGYGYGRRYRHWGDDD